MYIHMIQQDINELGINSNGKTLTVTGHMMARLIVRLIVHACMADDGR